MNEKIIHIPFIIFQPFRIKTCYECQDQGPYDGPESNTFTCGEDEGNDDFLQVLCRGSCKIEWEKDDTGKLVTKRFCSYYQKDATPVCDHDNPTDGQECFCNSELCNGLEGSGSGIPRIFSFLIWFSIAIKSL